MPFVAGERMRSARRLIELRPRIAGSQHAHADGASVLDDVGDDVAAERGGQRFVDVGGGHAEQRRALRIDAERDSGSADDDAVEDIDHAIDFRDRCRRSAPRVRCNAVGVLAEERGSRSATGELTRSPIRSVRMPRNSTRSAGSLDSIFWRSSLVTSSVARRSSFSLTAKSPVFGSVTPARPSCRPVRRE